jgi:nitrite reductase/ring-hydroxylating ferredoxin subunit
MANMDTGLRRYDRWVGAIRQLVSIREIQRMPEGFVAVAKVSDLAPGEMKFAAVEGERIVLANVEGGFYALRDVCGHRNAPLSRGKLEGCVIECPLHFAQFDIRTGKFIDGPLATDVPAYEVIVEGDTVYARR